MNQTNILSKEQNKTFKGQQKQPIKIKNTTINQLNKNLRVVTNQKQKRQTVLKFNQVKLSKYLPPIKKNLIKINPEMNLKRKVSNLINSSINQNNYNNSQSVLKKHSRIIFHPAKSVLVKKKAYQIEDESQNFLPAFIKNFKLPPKQQKIVIPTLQTYKIRETTISKYLSPESQIKNYRIISHIGKGSFSFVSMAININTNKKIAIKTYQKIDQIQIGKFQNIEKQIKNMFKLKQHQNVISLEKVIIQKRKVLLIMQNGGKQSLAGIMRKKKILTESQAKNYFLQILEGISYCHKNNVCHRDLKLENILVDDYNRIKIIDFGFSADSNKFLNSFCGTPPYMAPEITLKNLYNGRQIDMWSLGVILYVMVYGKFPFRSNNQTQLFRLIQQGKFIHDQSINISIQAKQAINKMIKNKSQERATAYQMLNCKWLHN